MNIDNIVKLPFLNRFCQEKNRKNILKMNKSYTKPISLITGKFEIASCTDVAREKKENLF